MLRLGCCCYICKRWFLLILRRAFCPLEGGGGGADILAPGLQSKARTYIRRAF